MITFYGGPLSSFAQRDIWLPPAYEGAPEDGQPIWYGCREEYFAGAKATNVHDHDWVITARPDTWEVKRRGRSIVLRPGWDDGLNYVTMLRCILNELRTDKDLFGYLMSTLDEDIAEDSPTDSVWGIRGRDGAVGSGRNLLGLAWMQARAACRREPALHWAANAPTCQPQDRPILMRAAESLALT